MHVMLALLLQVASLLLASAVDSTRVNFIQQAVLREKATLESNVTTLDKAIQQSLTSDSEEIAQEQLDRLSLVTRYAGTGYNLVRGNPEGDFNKGGVDPGIRTTNFIFTHTYAMRKEAFYRGRAMDVPDQVNFHMSQSCASSHTVQAYSGRKSYMKELERSVSVSGGYSGLIASVSFSLSYGMAKAESMTEKKKRIIIEKNKICNYGKARYLYENAVAQEHEYTLTRGFKNSVKYQLPTRYNTKAYLRFIEQWGTHIIQALDVGTRRIMKSSSSYVQVYKYLKKRNSLSTSLSGRYGTFTASASFGMKNLNQNINQNTKLGKSVIKFTIGSRDVPLPIHLELVPITKALDKIWWGNLTEWKRDKIDQKQRNLAKALKDYPRNVHAKINKDPKIRIKLPQQWPDGTYALPMPRGGCPRHWKYGNRKQDTEDHRNKNRKSWGIEKKMRVYVGRDIIFHYCVKTFRGNVGFRWPRGTYCIAKKGSCPSRFRPGSIYWDDEDYRNKNRIWGTLPDGRYDRNTEVQYCCRRDGSPHKPIVLPRRKPFILYRYRGRCQRVRGMHYQQLYIKWDDQDFRNEDRCRGHHPDATCRKDQRLTFCYYRR